MIVRNYFIQVSIKPKLLHTIERDYTTVVTAMVTFTSWFADPETAMNEALALAIESCHHFNSTNCMVMSFTRC